MIDVTYRAFFIVQYNGPTNGRQITTNTTNIRTETILSRSPTYPSIDGKGDTKPNAENTSAGADRSCDEKEPGVGIRPWQFVVEHSHRIGVQDVTGNEKETGGEITQTETGEINVGRELHRATNQNRETQCIAPSAEKTNEETANAAQIMIERISGERLSNRFSQIGRI